MEWNWDDELKKYVIELTAPIDGIVMGRKLAEGFIPHWAAAAADPQNPERPFAQKMHETPKVVFSHTLERVEWENATLAKRDLVEEITALKQEPKQDIVVYGGANFASLGLLLSTCTKRITRP